jgi:hypothetical protein
MSKSRLWLSPDTAQFALWDERHPLFEKHGAETRLVETQYGSVNVKIPARLGDAELANTIALTGAYFGGGFLNAHRLLPYAITESVAQTYLRRGGTIQAGSTISPTWASSRTRAPTIILSLICGCSGAWMIQRVGSPAGRDISTPGRTAGRPARPSRVATTLKTLGSLIRYCTATICPAPVA